jgi:RNA recognition motif-containing protein
MSFLPRFGKNFNKFLIFFQEKNCLLKINAFLCRVFKQIYFIFMNIYVGNLNYRVRENDLRSRFEQYGTVESAKVVKDRETGRSKGFGFVEMADDGDAQVAIAELNEKEFDGRNMVVKEALPK